MSKKKNKPRTHMPARNVNRMTDEQFARHQLNGYRYQIERLTKAMDEYIRIRGQYGTVEPQLPYVVMCEGVFLQFQQFNHGGAAIPLSCTVEVANRFAKEIAERFADNLTHAALTETGNPQKFEAVHIFDALDQVIVGHQQAIEYFSTEAQNIEKSLSTVH